MKLNAHQFVKNILSILIMAGMLHGGCALAVDEMMTRALKLHEKHHYVEAVNLLQPEWLRMDSSRQATSGLALGMIHLSSAKLYRELHQTALLIEQDYLRKLHKQKTSANSQYVNYYLGQTLLAAGKPTEAVTYLDRVKDKAGSKSPLKPYANIEMGLAYTKLKKSASAATLWSGVNTKDPELKAALAGAYAAAGVRGKKPAEMADAALLEAEKQRHAPSPRMLRNLLRAYAQDGATNKAIALLVKYDMKEAAFVEELGARKAISFYDVSLLEDMARSHLDAAVQHLERARTDTKLSSNAIYYLADAYLQQGKAEPALRAATDFLAQAQIPAQYANHARINQASARYLAGQRNEAHADWLSLADKSVADPAVLAEIVHACIQAGADCAKIEKISLTVADKGEGKKFFTLNAALGKYYLLQKDYAKAVTYMEAGRDKAYKNKIEVNNPLMLTALAEAYYRTRKFSESLEIYFEIGKEFPVVRQIQDSIQGIYAMEHQSAGEVKIF